MLTKTKSIIIVLAILIVSPIFADTVIVHKSWHDAMYNTGDTIDSINFEQISPFSYKISSDYKPTKKLMKQMRDSIVAISCSDSMLLVNDEYLNRNFASDCIFRGYIPLYLTDKVIYFKYFASDHTSSGAVALGILGEILSGGDDDYSISSGVVNDDDYDGLFYILDPKLKMAVKIDKGRLLNLLDNYPDLKRRYESTSYNKSSYVINSYFLDYIDAVNQDDRVAYPEY